MNSGHGSMTSTPMESNSAEELKALSPAETQKIISWTKQQFNEMKMARTQFERQWYLNLAFFFGRQNVAFRSNPGNVFGPAGMLYVPEAPPWRARPVINRIRATVRREMAKLNGNKPTAYVMPASNEDRDIFAAQAGEDIWENCYREKNFRYVLRRATFWSTICGNGFIKTFWDPFAFDPVSKVMGDFGYKPESPFHLFVPDVREESIEDQPFLIHAQMRSLDYVKMFFAPNREAIQDLDIAPSGSADELLDDTWLNMVGTPKRQKQVLCMEVWVKPGVVAQFPHGAMFTVVDNFIAPGGMYGWPYEHGLFPFAKLDNIPSGKFYSDSILVDLIPIQKELNRTRGQIIEAKNRMARPQWTAEQGSIDPKKMTSEPGQVLLFKMGYNPPTQVQMAPLPNYVIQEYENQVRDFGELSGQNETSKGQVPPGVTAATAISYLQEQNDSMLAANYDSLEEAVEKCAHMTLSLAHQYWTEERIVKVTGPGGSFDAKAFKGSDLNGNTDIRVEAGSALPTSKAATQAFIMDLMNMGYVDPQKGLELMRISSLNKLYEEVHVDTGQAQRENLKLAAITEQDLGTYAQEMQAQFQTNPDEFYTGTNPEDPMRAPVNPPPIIPANSWDNHMVHITIHNNYRKSQSFDNAPQHVRDLFEEHVNHHLTMMGMIPPEGDVETKPGEPEPEPEQPGPEPIPEVSSNGPEGY